MSAWDVGLLARRLTTGIYVHSAAVAIARATWGQESPPTAPVTEYLGAGFVRRSDGTAHEYDWCHHIEVARTDLGLNDELDRMWFASAVVLLGDALAAEDYFDRAPILEMVRHLRNGIAHGNRFEIRDPSALAEWPAHTRDAACCSQSGATFEITSELNDMRVLFDYMGPGDVLDVLISVGTRLLAR